METKKVFEYIVTKDWYDGLEKGTRLYYDHNKQGYVYHYESERTEKNNLGTSTRFTIEDRFISINSATDGIKNDTLTPGPELGELEYKEERYAVSEPKPCSCPNCKCNKLE